MTVCSYASELLDAVAAKWKEPPRDALDTLTLGAVDMKSLERCTQLDYMPFDPVRSSRATQSVT